MKGVVLAVIFVLLSVTQADICAIKYPPDVEKCLNSFGNADSTKYVGEDIACFCISTFVFLNKKKIMPRVVTKEEIEYVNKISRPSTTGRQKRATFLPPGNVRIRKEYRLLTAGERGRYHRCMRLLKTSRDANGMSRYDRLVRIHSNGVDAHRGEHFLPWHRIYLWMLENELRDLGGECSQVTLPYWDCSAEYYANLFEPRSGQHSIIFSDEFAGIGPRGTYSDWGLVRDIAPNGRLFGRERIRDLKANGQSSTILNPFHYWSIERDHNMIHRFVGGGLNDLSTAPEDPVFFLLHCYIDFVWQEVRLTLPDPSFYPFDDSVTMDRLSNWTIAEGMSELWHQRHVQYQPSFGCESGSSCDGIEGLRCEYFEDLGRRCMSSRQQEQQQEQQQQEQWENWWTWAWRKRKRRAISRHHSHDCSTAHPRTTIDRKVHVCNKQTCPSDPLSMQNTFMLNDVTDGSRWVYLPVKVTYERPRGLKFDAYSCYKGKNAPVINTTMDIYDPDFNPDLARHLYTGEAKSYESCRISGEGSAKVFIRSDGINYMGNAVEYAIMDDRYPLSSQKAFVPIKDPTVNDTVVCLLAYDTCGRLCLPTCRLKGSHPTAYTPCSGCIKVNNAFPKMYGRSVADLVTSQWTFNDIGKTNFLDPTESDNDIFLKFVCDSSSKFPWKRQ
uniref:Tyrosinase 3 n=1 Tax=Azumapecten farreri TaxID=106299 RepID=A0A222YTC9_AZUFA|nr:tyrosinase 3 [Azumapecten farreri]